MNKEPNGRAPVERTVRLGDKMKKIIIEQEDICVSDSLKKAIAESVQETINEWVESLADPFCHFEEREPVGTFSIWLDTDNEVKITTTLNKLVDVSITVNEHKDYHNAIADEFERLAKILRDA